MQKLLDGVWSISRRAPLVALAAAALATSAAAPALAKTSAKLKEEFAPFADCPVTSAADCVYALTTGGEFIIGHKTVPIDKTITLQGGLASTSYDAQPLIGAVNGPTLSQTPLTVPGGLVGIDELGGEVSATAELAGPPSSVTVNRLNFTVLSGAAVTLPLKVHLENSALGSDCYIGSDSEPILLHLTTGTTSPPPPAEPIKGSRALPSLGGKGKIVIIPKDTLVDNDFAVPGASGCGPELLSSVVDEVVDLDVGIPSAAGENTAIMSGSLEETAAEYAAKYNKPAKKKS
ncbi:MAG TPA: hypothetical protein VMF09_12550 [Solirubrobacteraceae bacterium]|nr:hypothetical protein [Solirubrobacteraceae bacterium]